MSRYAPISSEERRELREAADELGITVDELERRMSADLDEREAEVRRRQQPAEAVEAAVGQWVPAPPRPPEDYLLDEATIELGLRKVAELRKQLAARQASQPTEEVTP